MIFEKTETVPTRLAMKIALLTQYYKPEMGAPQNRLYEMMAGLKRLGNEVQVVTGMPNYPTGSVFKEYRRKFSRKEVIDGIEVKRYWLYASNSKKALPRILNMLSFSVSSFFSIGYLRKKRPDVLIVESPPLTLCLTAWMISRLLGIKLVSNISDLWPLSAKELGALSEKSFLYRALEKTESFIYRKSALCMGQSAQIVEYIRQHGGKSVYLFRNGVDPGRFPETPSRKEGGKFRIVYAGLLGFAQGILDICRNVDFAALGVEFHIYGAGGEQAGIERYLAQNPGKGIFYHGKAGREEIPGILSQADATLVPLVKNIFGAVPSKIYESMAAGVPIIFSGEGEGRKIVEDHDIGWGSDSKDYAGIARNIRAFMENPEEVARKSRNCRECASNLFNRPKQIEALDKFFKETLSGGKSGGGKSGGGSSRR